MNGLLEWHGIVHSNGIQMKVDFTNGTTTAYGVAPATFITKDTLTQHIMENSDEFKGGRIFLVRSVPLPGEEDDSIIAEPTVASAEEPDSNVAEEAPADVTEPTTPDGAPIKVATKSDAIEWLKEHYPEKEYTGVKLRSKAAFDAACAECGVVFEITE